MSPTKELVAQKTPVSQFEFYNALKLACPELAPKSICLLLAHWAIETGHGKKCMNYNIGNMKAPHTSDGDYCYFETYERLPVVEAQAIAAKSSPGEPAKVLSTFGSGYALIVFEPKHPGCRFLAYETLADGVEDYVRHLKKEFAEAWEDVISGDAISFSHHLKQQGYYTALECVYTKAIIKLWEGYVRSFA